MKLYNTLTKQIENFKSLKSGEVRIYSCGPTVYDHIHIGNLASFIYTDTLRRVVKASSPGDSIKHVMNFTDVDDKTIARSKTKYPNIEPKEALLKLTKKYDALFRQDMKAIGNDLEALEFVRATDSIPEMQELIAELHKDGFAYITDDGVYFSIEAYKKSGKKYGQLTQIDSSNTSQSRINNDEYDKTSVNDFALWKLKKDGEPAWDFSLGGKEVNGRPGWHIECSAMSRKALEQPFDVHTGGVDLIFPHHENEIAQSTACKESPVLAQIFVHNEHLLVNNKKMSKSLKNFYTLDDIKNKGIDPLAFRLMVLQSHYRSQSNFTWDNLGAAHNRLKAIRAFADLRFQDNPDVTMLGDNYFEYQEKNIRQALNNNLNVPEALRLISEVIEHIQIYGGGSIQMLNLKGFNVFIAFLDDLLGLSLSESIDITEQQKMIVNQREKSRQIKDWAKTDKLRHELEKDGIALNDTKTGPIWRRL